MAEEQVFKKFSLEDQKITGLKKVFWNLPAEVLYEEVIRRGEAKLALYGPLAVRTGKYTGRSPNDKFTVKEPDSEGKIWWGRVNRPFDPQKFEDIHKKMLDYLRGKEVFVRDCYAGADPASRVPIRVITEYAWHSLFALNMFVRPAPAEALGDHNPEFTIISLPGFNADPKKDGTNSEAFIIPNFGSGLVLIGGTSYAGEIKKSVFTLLNYFYPQKNILSMHCSANMGKNGDTAVFFGLSGTGKTTLSADPGRRLIGDDEHGWSDSGIFNFEGGCYAKVVRLSEEAEPLIYSCTERFGTILENVVMNPESRELDLDNAMYTENTRASYPLEFIPDAVVEGVGGHPVHVIMLTCDAFGVLPPVSLLSAPQAMYHFLSGYTAKVAGTERGIKEPQATFSACFGAPFMALHPGVYAKLLGEKIARHGVSCWLVNTGWIGGGYGAGKRIAIADSRAIIRAILDGKLSGVSCAKDPMFGFEVPASCPGLSHQEILNPRNTWKDKAGFDARALELAKRFHQNFGQFESGVSEKIRLAGPQV